MLNGSVFHFDVARFSSLSLSAILEVILEAESELCSHEPLFENFFLRLRFHRFSMARDLDIEISSFFPFSVSFACSVLCKHPPRQDIV